MDFGPIFSATRARLAASSATRSSSRKTGAAGATRIEGGSGELVARPDWMKPPNALRTSTAATDAARTLLKLIFFKTHHSLISVSQSAAEDFATEAQRHR